MSKKLKYSFLGLVVLFLLIQFIPVDRNNPPVDENMVIQAPAEVTVILEKSCYDCHSNLTNWPIYSYIAPISWMVADDVKEARKHMNFTEWNKYPEKRQTRMKENMVDDIMSNDMPLPMYLEAHSDAKLTMHQKETIKNWVEAVGDSTVTDDSTNDGDD